MVNKDVVSKQSLLDIIRERGIIYISAHWGETSAQYLDPDTGEPAGVVGLVGELLAQDLGVRAEFVNMPWNDHISALLVGRVDISVKHTLTPQRAFQVEFTVEGILCEEGRIVIRRDRGLNSEADLNQHHRIIAVSTGASQQVHIQRRYPQAQTRLFPTAQETFDAVAAGEVDACLHDTKVPGFLQTHPECTVMTGPDDQAIVPYIDCVHPCIKPGDPRFLNWLNSWISFHKASGMFKELIHEAEKIHKTKFTQITAGG